MKERTSGSVQLRPGQAGCTQGKREVINLVLTFGHRSDGLAIFKRMSSSLRARRPLLIVGGRYYHQCLNQWMWLKHGSEFLGFIAKLSFFSWSNLSVLSNYRDKPSFGAVDGTQVQFYQHLSSVRVSESSRNVPGRRWEFIAPFPFASSTAYALATWIRIIQSRKVFLYPEAFSLDSIPLITILMELFHISPSWWYFNVPVPGHVIDLDVVRVRFRGRVCFLFLTVSSFQ